MASRKPLPIPPTEEMSKTLILNSNNPEFYQNSMDYSGNSRPSNIEYGYHSTYNPPPSNPPHNMSPSPAPMPPHTIHYSNTATTNNDNNIITRSTLDSHSYERPLSNSFYAPMVPKDELPKTKKTGFARLISVQRPYFFWVVTAAQIIMLLVSLIVNQQKTGELIETNPINPLIGPSTGVSNVAKFQYLKMRSEFLL